MATLQALPEPLRSQMLRGDFQAGTEDDEWQVIPTAWIDAAMDRWKPRAPTGEMMALGCDVARGGRDSTVIARRHKTEHTELWFDRPLVYPGANTPDGPTVAGLVIGALRDRAPILIDVIGVGASPYDVLRGMGLDIYGVNVAEKASGLDESGRLQFFNQRTELIWKFREALDPRNDTGICLPPDQRLRADLAAYTWEPRGAAVFVHSRDDIVKRIGRSPDWASAYALALMERPKMRSMRDRARLDRERAEVLNYDPLAGR